MTSVGKPLVWMMLFAFLSGCSTTNRITENQPDWWSNPQQHGTEFLFFKAMGESPVSMEEARRQAMISVQRQVADYIMTEVSVVTNAGIRPTDLERVIQLSEVTTMGHPHDAKIGSRWYVWVLGRYPVPEYQRIRKRIEAGLELQADWIEAQSLVNRQQYVSAEPKLDRILKDFSEALVLAFSLDEVKLSMATVQLKQGRNLKARQWALDVKKNASDSVWQQRASEVLASIPPVTIKDAFEDRMVSLVFYRDDGGASTPDASLTKLLNDRLAGLGISTVAFPVEIPALGPVMDDQSLNGLATAIQGKDVDLLLVAKLSVDADKTGKKQEVFGVAQEQLDARLNYWVVRAENGEVLVSGQTAGYSSKVEAMLHVMTSHRRHLPGSASQIVEAMID